MLKPERSEGLESQLDSEADPRPTSFWWRWTGRLLFLAAVIAAAATYKSWKPWVANWMPAAAAPPGRPPARPTPVAIAKATTENIDLYINALGTVTAFNTVTVRSRVDGELKNVAFKEGQTVNKGDLLVELDSRPFEALRDQALGQMQRDQAQLDLARVNLERARILRSRDANSQQEYDEQLALFRQAESIVKIDQGNLENAELQVQYTRITSPITGRIGLRIVDLGNIVKANDPNGLMVITQLQPISLVFAIPQDEIHRVQLQLNQRGQLMVEAFNRDFSTKLAEGQLTAIDNQVDATTGTLKLKATFANEDNLLFPNEFVNVRLKVETLENAVTVPAIAVQRGPQDRYVYVVKKGEPSDKPAGDKPTGDKPTGDKPSGEKASAEKSSDAVSKTEPVRAEPVKGEPVQSRTALGDGNRDGKTPTEKAAGDKSKGDGPKGDRSKGDGPKGDGSKGERGGRNEPENIVEVRSVVVGPTEGLRTVIRSGLEAGEIVVTEGLDKLQPGSKVILPKSE